MPGPEQELQDKAVALLRSHHFLVAHFRAAKTDRGWRTPVAADGLGFFDLVALRPSTPALFIEVKSSTGRLSPDQIDWWRAVHASAGSIYFQLSPATWPTFERDIAGIAVFNRMPDDWPDVLEKRKWRHDMTKARNQLASRIEAGERITPATMTTNLLWTANEPVVIGSKTYAYKGHEADGGVCVYGPGIMHDGRFAAAQTAKFRCFPAGSKIKRAKGAKP